MKKRKWKRVFSVLLVMVTVISLMSGCGKKSAKKDVELASIGIDTWGVDFVLVGKENKCWLHS